MNIFCDLPYLYFRTLVSCNNIIVSLYQTGKSKRCGKKDIYVLIILQIIVFHTRNDLSIALPAFSIGKFFQLKGF